MNEIKLEPVYFVFSPRLRRFVGKKSPTYAILAGAGDEPDTFWWAESQVGASCWTGIDGVRRFRTLCSSSAKNFGEFVVLGTDGSSTPLTSA